MDVTAALIALGISASLGLLVGMQRERAHSEIAGIRTFPLIVMLGTVCAMIDGEAGGWVVPAGLVAVAVATAMGNWARRRPQRDPGITTEIAIVLMYGVGVLVWMMPEGRYLPAALAAACAALLYLKRPLHGMVARFREDEVRAILRFVVIWLVVLPLLPDRAMGPWNALNPREVWWMVVLVEGLSLAAYAASRLLPAAAGMAAGGMLGGLISSTATTATMARRAAASADLSRAAAAAVALAWVVTFGRVFVEIGVAGPSLVKTALAPLGVVAAAGAAGAAALWMVARKSRTVVPRVENPTQIKGALVFAGLYALVCLASAGARELIGPGAVYGVAAISGLTDMDAITLSTSRLAEQGGISGAQAWRVILVAAMSNTVFKAGLAATLGGRVFGRLAAVPAGMTLLAGAAVLAFWP